MSDIADALRVTDPNFDLSSIDPQSTPAYDGKKADGEDDLADGADHLSELQERLFASSKAGSTRSVLLMIQGMDTAGKGGIVRHVVGQVDPQVCRSRASRRRPTKRSSTTSCGASARLFPSPA